MPSFKWTVASILFAAGLCTSVPAFAESGKYNLHLKLAGSLPPGPSLEAGFDWQFKRGIAVDVLVSGGYSSETGPMGQVTGGMRFRFADDYSGYSNEPGGSAKGNFYLAPHAGVLIAALGAGLTTDVEVGYEWSVAKPVQIGLFARPGVIVSSFVAPYAFVGVQASIEFEPIRPGDADRDRVVDLRDRCPDTPLGVDVDGRGCPVIPKQLVLEGVLFEYGSTAIVPGSEEALQRARRILLDNPTVKVEIAGHTDNTGDAAFNLALSRDRAQAVADWLVGHGVDPHQLTVAGYGSDQPVASNATEEGRQQNRRIEFKRREP